MGSKQLNLKLIVVNFIAFGIIVILQATLYATIVKDKPAEKAKASVVEEKDCLSSGCHTFSDKKYLHEPYVEKNCLACHTPAGNHYELKEKGDKLCFSCHQDLVEKIEVSVHGPDSGLTCLSCHKQHASDYPFLLNEEPIKQCTACHEEGNSHPVGGDLIDDQTGNKLTCTSSCHAPHGEGVPDNLLLRKDNNDGLCLSCHDRIGIDY